MSISEIIQEAKTYHENAITSEKHLIVQRDKNRFWPVIFKQKFDLSTQKISVRFAGEAAADAGGPLREFLTLTMQQVCDILGLLFGDNNALYFKTFPERKKKQEYHKIAQLVGLAVLNLGI